MASGSDIMVAKHSYATSLDGVPVVVYAGQTRARAGHVLVRNYPDAWEPADYELHYDVEDASAMPGVKRGDVAALRPEREAAKVVSEQPKQAARFATGKPDKSGKSAGDK